MHTLICVTFSLRPGVGSWLWFLLVALPGLFCLPFFLELRCGKFHCLALWILVICILPDPGLKKKGSQKYPWICLKVFAKLNLLKQTAWKSDIYFWRDCDFMFSKWLPKAAAILKSTWKLKIMKLNIFLKNMHTLALLTIAIFVYYVNNHFMGLFQECVL